MKTQSIFHLSLNFRGSTRRKFNSYDDHISEDVDNTSKDVDVHMSEDVGILDISKEGELSELVNQEVGETLDQSSDEHLES